MWATDEHRFVIDQPEGYAHFSVRNFVQRGPLYEQPQVTGTRLMTSSGLCEFAKRPKGEWRGSQPLRQYTPVQSMVTIDSVMACAYRKSSTARRQFGSAP